MPRLEPPDIHFVSAAVGWLELGAIAESKAELALVRLELQKHPDVLEVHWRIAAEEKAWDTALRVARDLLQAEPDRTSGWLHQAYALRRAPGGGLKQAWEALLPAFPKFPQEPTIPYNLSCYACQMNDLDAARVWLKRAVAAGDKERIREMALLDPDLEPLWEEIKNL